MGNLGKNALRFGKDSAMRGVYVGVIGLVGLAVLNSSANAQQDFIRAPLVQTAKPTDLSYPGVNADILGIRPGMTVSQAEAIAAKNFSTKPTESITSLSISYRGLLVRSQPFIGSVVFKNYKTNEVLNLFISSPATGNVVIGIDHQILLSGITNQPLFSAVKASLIKKYGPLSSQLLSQYVNSYWWQFGKDLPYALRSHCSREQSC